MFIYENTTEKMEYKKIMAFRKMFDKMANASRDEPGWSIATFVNGFSLPLTVGIVYSLTLN
jgi:hypothetical protein